jgi:hypothetical protein
LALDQQNTHNNIQLADSMVPSEIRNSSNSNRQKQSHAADHTPLLQRPRSRAIPPNPLPNLPHGSSSSTTKWGGSGNQSSETDKPPHPDREPKRWRRRGSPATPLETAPNPTPATATGARSLEPPNQPTNQVGKMNRGGGRMRTYRRGGALAGGAEARRGGRARGGGGGVRMRTYRRGGALANVP